jgi:hypothetical protein
VLSSVRIRVDEWHLHSEHHSHVNKHRNCRVLALHTYLTFLFFDAETPYTHITMHAH